MKTSTKKTFRKFPYQGDFDVAQALFDSKHSAGLFDTHVTVYLRGKLHVPCKTLMDRSNMRCSEKS